MRSLLFTRCSLFITARADSRREGDGDEDARCGYAHTLLLICFAVSYLYIPYDNRGYVVPCCALRLHTYIRSFTDTPVPSGANGSMDVESLSHDYRTVVSSCKLTNGPHAIGSRTPYPRSRNRGLRVRDQPTLA